MRRTLASLGFGSIVLLPVLFGSSLGGCNAPSEGTTEHVIRAAQPIQGGTVDQTDTAVVGILICQGSQVSSLCSGSLIGPNLVLTAHHCVANPNSTTCNSGYGTQSPASDFYVTTSYDQAANIFNSSSAACPTADGVTWWGTSAVATPGTNICGDDMATLTLSSSVPTSVACPLIPSVDTNVTTGEGYTAIGFGITSPNGQTAGTRYKVTGMSVQCTTNCGSGQSATLEWTGGATAQKGTCEGDSGGPALDSSNRILGTVSRGPQGACNSTVYESVYGSAAWIKAQAAAAATKGGYTAAGWVTGGATSDPSNGYCGTSSSSSSSSSTGGTTTTTGSSSSSSSSSGGGGVPTTCSDADGTIGCCTSTGVNYYCTASNKVTHTTCKTGTVCGWDATNMYYGCVAPPGGADPSNTYPELCGGTTSTTSTTTTGTGTTSATSTSSSTGGGACSGEMATGDATCDTCLDNTCCSQLTACLADNTCVTCASTATPASSCAQNTAFVSFENCIGGPCATACGGSSSTTGTGGSTTATTTTTGGTGGASTGTTTTGQTTGVGGATASTTNGTGTGSGTGGATTTGTATGTGTATTSSSGFFGTGGGTGTAQTGTGTGTGTTGNGTGTGNSGSGFTPSQPSGCDVASTGTGGDGAPASPAALGLLVGLGLIVSRRRR